MIAAPINGHVVEALLKFGGYEKPLVAEERDYGIWQACAMLLARDVDAWVNKSGAVGEDAVSSHRAPRAP